MKILAVWIVAASTVAAHAEGPFSPLSFEDACAAAKKDGKVVMIDFYTTWCGPCKQLDRTTWKDEKVCDWLARKTVALKLDAEKETKLAKKYKIAGYPTMLLIKPDGTEIDRIVGYRDANAFITEADGALSGKDSVARAREKLANGNDNNPMMRMQVARALADKGKLDEALKEYLWCFDHGNENMAGYGGVRLSFLLSDIGRLGHSHPPAMEALRTRRDRAEETLMSGKTASSKPKKGLAAMFGGGRDTGLEAASDFAALNGTLGEPRRTLAAYDKLRKQKGREATCKALFRHIFDELLKARRYDDIYADCGDPMQTLDRLIDGSKGKGMFGSRDKQLKEYYKRQVVQDGGKYYEVLLGAGQANTADELAKKVLSVNASASTYERLVAHARRAGHAAAADGLIVEAEKTLDAGELARVKQSTADDVDHDE